MKAPEKICRDFTRRLTQFFDSTENKRKEDAIMWEYYDYHPTEGQTAEHEALNDFSGKLNSRPVVKKGGRKAENAPVVSAYINAVVGMMLRDSKRIVAYSSNDKERVESNALNKGFRYFDAVTHRKDVKMQQATSTAVTGVGGTVAYLDYTIDGAIAGQPVYEEKDNLFYDRGQGGDLHSDKISWCGYADAMYREDLQEYIEKCKTSKNYIGSDCPTSFKDKILEYKHYEDEEEIDFLYTYFWREYRKVWDVENPFLVIPEYLLMLTEDFPEAANVFMETADSLQLDFNQTHFTLDDKGYRLFKELVKNLEFMTEVEVPEIEASSRMGRAYYRAEFADGMLIKAGRTYTTQCHPMSFTTAYYDRTYGYHYGLMRPLAYYQKMLNSTFSDLTTYSSRSSSGGNVAIKGAGDTIEIIKKALEDGHQVTPAKGDMEISNIGTPDAAQAIMGTTDMILKMIPMAIGMPPELFGMLSTGDMTSSLMNKIQNQMNATLSHLYTTFDRSTLTDGWIQRDMFMSMADSIKGKLPLSFVLGGEEGVFELSKQDMARNYSIHLVEREATRDEELESFEKLVDMVKLLPPEQIAAAMPLLIEASPLYFGKKEKLMEALTPPQPDPQAQQIATRQTEAQIRLVEAQAYQLENQGKADAARAEVAGREAALKIDSEQADIAETISKMRKNLADAKEKEAKTGKSKVETARELLKPLEG